MYNHAPMMAICRQGMVLDLELKAGVLSRSSSEIVVTKRILKWLFQLYLKTREQKKSSRITYTFKIIQSLDGKVMSREAVLVIVLFNNLPNNINSIDRVCHKLHSACISTTSGLIFIN